MCYTSLVTCRFWTYMGGLYVPILTSSETMRTCHKYVHRRGMTRPCWQDLTWCAFSILVPTSKAIGRADHRTSFIREFICLGEEQQSERHDSWIDYCLSLLFGIFCNTRWSALELLFTVLKAGQLQQYVILFYDWILYMSTSGTGSGAVWQRLLFTMLSCPRCKSSTVKQDTLIAGRKMNEEHTNVCIGITIIHRGFWREFNVYSTKKIMLVLVQQRCNLASNMMDEMILYSYDQTKMSFMWTRVYAASGMWPFIAYLSQFFMHWSTKHHGL